LHFAFKMALPPCLLKNELKRAVDFTRWFDRFSVPLDENAFAKSERR
jgi:hypothetical protein